MFQGMKYVYAVYREKSFSRAAEKLFISQPSLSANVKREEENLGYPIFDRSTKPLGLTEPGARYIQAVERMMAVENELAEFMNDWGNLRTGRLILGGSSLYSSWVLPPLMGEFSRKYPQVHLELAENSTAQLESMLQSGEIDMVMDNSEWDSKIFEQKVYRQEQILLAVPRHLKSNTGLEKYQIPETMIYDQSFRKDSVPTVDLGAFRQEPFILLKPKNDTRIRAMKLCSQCGFTPDIIFELDQQMTSFNISSSGMGISFISDTLIARVPSHPEIVYYKLDKELSSRNLCFYWKKGRYLNRIMREFLKMV